MRLYTKTILPVLAALAALGAAHGAAANPLSVEMDKARTLRLSAPASAVVVGNPLVADAAILDRHTLVLTGKSYGVTNLIVIGADGRQIYDADLTVTEARSAQTSVVSLHRGGLRSTFACTGGGACQGMPTVGDAPDVYSTLSDQRAVKLGASHGESQQ